jgi:hypothetical protein
VKGAAIDVPAQMGLLFQPTTPRLVCCNDFKDATKARRPSSTEQHRCRHSEHQKPLIEYDAGALVHEHGRSQPGYVSDLASLLRARNPQMPCASTAIPHQSLRRPADPTKPLELLGRNEIACPSKGPRAGRALRRDRQLDVETVHCVRNRKRFARSLMRPLGDFGRFARLKPIQTANNHGERDHGILNAETSCTPMHLASRFWRSPGCNLARNRNREPVSALCFSAGGFEECQTH